MSILILILILLLICLGVPLFAAIGLSSVLQFLSANIDPTVVIVEMYKIASAPTLLAIPLFTFAGYVLAESKAPLRLYRFMDELLGWLPGGIAIVSLLMCAVFTCFTGASGITIIAIGGLVYPILLKQQYDEKFSLGLITCSGSLGLLFPPSLPLILYGVIASVSIDKLFLAGIIPGILIILILSIYSVMNEKVPATERKLPNLASLLLKGKDVIWEIPIPMIILGGIYGGFLTVVEASAVTAFYVLIAEFLLTKDLNIRKDTVRILRDSVQLVGGILIILSTAMGLTNFLVDAQLPQTILAGIRAFISSKITFLLLLNIFLLITGFLLDIFSAIIIVVPLIVPIATSYGVDPVHLGIIFLANLEIGYLTPPVGLNLFISSFRFNKSILYLYRVSIPFLLLLLLALLIITYIPDLTLFLVRIFAQ